MLQEFVTRVPDQIPALLKLVEVCVDGGLEADDVRGAGAAGRRLSRAGQAAEARVIAEDLVAREPWERAHIERFRRALVMLKVPDPDSLIADGSAARSRSPRRTSSPTRAAAPAPEPPAPSEPP